MPGAAPHGALVDVELSEEDELLEARRPWPARRLAWVALPVAVGLAVASMAQAAESAHGAHAFAALGTTAMGLSAPPAERWRVPGSLIGVAGDVVLVGDQRRGVQAVDAATGAVVWARAETGSCAMAVPDAFAATARPDGEPRRLVCGWAPGQVGREATSVEVLDPATGRRLSTASLPGSAGWWFVDHGDAFLVAAALDGAFTALRLDTSSGRVVWSFRSGDALVQPGGGFSASGLSSDEIMAAGSGGTIRLTQDTGVATTGRPILTARTAEHTSPLPGGAQVLGGRDTDGTAVVRALAADGTARWTVPGRLAAPATDDRSLGDLVVAVPADGRGLMALDAADGRVRWRAPGAPTGVEARVNGVLVTADRGRVVALDLRTGTQLWQAVPYGTGAVSDGGTVATLERVDGASRLVARDLRTGAELWRRTAGRELWPEITTYRGDRLVAVRHDLVLLGTDTEVVAFEPT
ncbi:MAG: PQQ-binding-like beta-propeller repeat protein [Actinomycetales bacterium]|nr:PQQ-binding-like beta-propeller repeat protein [Actinomycetales bacterium]